MPKSQHLFTSDVDEKNNNQHSQITESLFKGVDSVSSEIYAVALIAKKNNHAFIVIQGRNENGSNSLTVYNFGFKQESKEAEKKFNLAEIVAPKEGQFWGKHLAGLQNFASLKDYFDQHIMKDEQGYPCKAFEMPKQTVEGLKEIISIQMKTEHTYQYSGNNATAPRLSSQQPGHNCLTWARAVLLEASPELAEFLPETSSLMALPQQYLREITGEASSCCLIM
ncbi:MAG: hypothetical protein GKR77_03990 [Legionellales bacterium]|nr:hypothetical protein [Legionellales bacterium]